MDIRILHPSQRRHPVTQAVRAFFAALIRFVFPYRRVGSLPDGGALLVANHVSYFDALLLAAAAHPRRVRFLMHKSYYDRPLLGWVPRLIGTIPIASEDSAAAKRDSLGRAVEAVEAGELVAIFAEGELTRDGELGRFRTGLERIARPSGVPIIPVALGGLWGRRLTHAPKRRYSRKPLTVQFGDPLACDTAADDVREHVAELLDAASAGQAASVDG